MSEPCAVSLRCANLFVGHRRPRGGSCSDRTSRDPLSGTSRRRRLPRAPLTPRRAIADTVSAIRATPVPATLWGRVWRNQGAGAWAGGMDMIVKHERRSLLERALAGRLVAIVRLQQGERLLEVATALVAGGIRTLEFTLTTPAALAAIEACRVQLGEEVIIGAGSVLDGRDARRSLDAGAQFLVSPGFDPAVVAAAHAGGALAMPGALTPTEILAAWRAGADVVKVFPARAFGPSYIKDLASAAPADPPDANRWREHRECRSLSASRGGSCGRRGQPDRSRCGGWRRLGRDQRAGPCARASGGCGVAKHPDIETLPRRPSPAWINPQVVLAAAEGLPHSAPPVCAPPARPPSDSAAREVFRPGRLPAGSPQV